MLGRVGGTRGRGGRDARTRRVRLTTRRRKHPGRGGHDRGVGEQAHSLEEPATQRSLDYEGGPDMAGSGRSRVVREPSRNYQRRTRSASSRSTDIHGLTPEQVDLPGQVAWDCLSPTPEPGVLLEVVAGIGEVEAFVGQREVGDDGAGEGDR